MSHDDNALPRQVLSGTGRQLEPGLDLGGYVLNGLIAHSELSSVWLATNLEFDRHVVIKFPSKEFWDSTSEPDAKFRQEAKILALMHGSYFPVVDYLGEYEGCPFFVMRYFPGSPLRHFKPLPWQYAADIICHVCDAAGRLHRRGIVHRDIKPGNVLWMTPQQVKEIGFGQFGQPIRLIDFGLAGVPEELNLGPPEPADPAERGTIGTAAYMSPEQAMGLAPTLAMDIFGIGGTLYFLLTGKAPLPVQTHEHAAVFHRDHNVSESLELKGVPRAIAQVIRKALARSPEDRYESAAELRLAVIEAAKKTDRRELRRQRWIEAAVISFFVGAFALLALLFLLSN